MARDDACSGRHLGKLDEHWLDEFANLERHVELRGAMPRESKNQTSQVSGEARLAGWVRYQRRRAVRGILPDWQRELLEQITGFLWDPSNENWSRHLATLTAFLEREGRVPRYRSSNAEERRLAAWVHKQRHLHGRGELHQVRVDALRRLPFRIV
ncbi:hypothetical protein EEJ31_09975 [Cryobacterium tepidiphilum]|uniref:Helicase-associated domain-containing protein n=2 Tax=Cryobacterium tepidiphilum TaxID=2486026 RepID=A0A3M8L1D2_9MICO|nr:hypothetical protein EEJ31_09975 [Cryobacterium tepidiphilum]